MSGTHRLHPGHLDPQRSGTREVVAGWAILGLLLVAGAPDVDAQTRRTPAPARRTAPAPAAVAPKVEPAMVMCPQPLGDGVTTKQSYCDVMIGRDPLGGVIVTLPAHSGPVTLTFDLHNRHTYSEELVRNKQGYRRYTASIGVLTMDNTLLTRAAVQNEFRSSADLVDRISGGSGPGGLKAVAPTGTETISVTVPAEEDRVSILGEKLLEARPDGRDEFQASGRPIAIISNVMVSYRPPPARRTPTTRRR